MKHTSQLGQPNRPHSSWARTTQGNGRADDENKEEFKGCAGQEEKLC
jgi:hypothetical protein